MTVASLLVGERLRLIALQTGDAATIERWYQDSDFVRQFESAPAMPRTAESLGRWIEEEHRKTDSFLFAIRTLDTDTLIGLLHLDSAMWHHRSIWLAIGIGDAAYRGRGYGYEAMRLALQFAFDELNMHRLQLTVFNYNTPAIELYDRLGFTREGVFREAIMRDGQRYDMYLYGMLAHEWAQRRYG
jgi:RimJ/RimL family protein N-acetyltransferase